MASISAAVGNNVLFMSGTRGFSAGIKKDCISKASSLLMPNELLLVSLCLVLLCQSLSSYSENRYVK